MNTKSLLAAAAFAALAFGTTAAKAELIVNGGFETGDATGFTIAADTTNTDVYPTGSSDSAGPIYSHSGDYFLALGDQSESYPYGTVSQTVSDNPGDTLTLSYWFFSQGGTPNYFDANWNGTLLPGSVIQNTGPMDYTQYMFTVIATGSDTLAFHEQNLPLFSALDDISLTVAQTAPSVPEPASASLLCLALGALGLKRRRG